MDGKQSRSSFFQTKFSKWWGKLGTYTILSYRERLKELKLTTLLERRARGDLIEVFKIFNKHCNYGEGFFKRSHCRGGMNIALHDLTTNYAKINTFESRVAKFWNKLPSFVKESENVIDFKINLELYKQEKFEDSVGHYWSLSDEIFNRINDENRDSYVTFMLQNPHIAKRKNINLY